MAKTPKLHPRNQHIDGYDFPRLLSDTPALEDYTVTNPAGQPTINFQDPAAVRMLNRALLKTHYGVAHWDIPPKYLCPPIPGRVDYIHYLADLLASSNNTKVPHGAGVKALDIGTGASLVYPLVGHSAYGWDFTGVDIDAAALASARNIRDLNALPITLRHQENRQNVFRDVIKHKDFFHVTLCNPPFHASKEKAVKGTERKWANLGKGQSRALNFGGQNAELWCPGGEIKFIATMIEQSTAYARQCLWFTSLVSKKDNLRPISRILKKAGVADVEVVEMAQGQKTSRFVAWTFIKRSQRSGFLQGL